MSRHRRRRVDPHAEYARAAAEHTRIVETRATVMIWLLAAMGVVPLLPYVAVAAVLLAIVVLSWF